MARKHLELSNEEQANLDDIRTIFKLFGRAMSLSCVAATANARVEDEAIEAMDRAWENLADAVVEFAMKED